MVILPRTEMWIAFVSMLVAVTATACPEGQFWHQDTSTCCVPTFDCDIDSEVVACTVSGEADQCVSCGDGRTNGYVTSSLDHEQHRCFNKTAQHIKCPHGDTVPIPTFLHEQCAQPCRCRHEDCYYGDSCSCGQLPQPCGLDEEMDPNTGTCVPCPEGKHKPEEGCQPCRWKQGSTAWMKVTTPTVDIAHTNTEATGTPKNPGYNTVDSQDGEPEDEPNTTEEKKGDKEGISMVFVIQWVNSGYNTVDTQDGEPEDEPNTTEEEKGDKEGISMVFVIILIVLLVSTGILVAVFLVILRRKIKSGDTTSRLVVCYNKITGSGSQTQQQDPEAGNSVAAAPREEEKAVPVQEVTPMIQSDVSANAAATGHDDDCQQLQTLQQLETSPAEPHDDDNDDDTTGVNTTTTPLIGGTELETDETEQKTKE